MGKEKRLFKNILIYGIGNIGAKLITFFLFPLYTHYLKTSDLGYFDISLSVVMLLLPFFTLQLREGVFRFALEAERKERDKIYKYVFQRIMKNVLCMSILAIITDFFFEVPYLIYILGLLIFYGIFEVQTFILRTENKKYFVIVNIISVFFNLLLFYLFVIWGNLGLLGLFLSNLLSRAISVILIEIRFCFIIASLFNKTIVIDKKLSSEILKYSLMMIPMGISGFLIDIIGKFFIKHNLGLDENGIYAVAAKFMNILLFLSYIFYQAWQETAILEYKSPNRDAFFSKIFHSYLLVLSCLCGIACLTLKMFYPYMIASEYLESLQYVYPLLIGVLLIAMVSFLDLGYQCAKEANRSVYSVVYSVILNFILNYLLVKKFGLNGVAITFCLTYLFLFIYRFFSTRRYFKIAWSNLSVFSGIVLIVSGMLFYQVENIYILSLYSVLLMILAVVLLMKSNNIDVKNLS